MILRGLRLLPHSGLITLSANEQPLRYIVSPLSCNEPWLLSYFTQSVKLNPDARVLKIDIILPLSVQNYIKLYSFTRTVYDVIVTWQEQKCMLPTSCRDLSESLIH